jgi:hypothetical protein
MGLVGVFVISESQINVQVKQTLYPKLIVYRHTKHDDPLNNNKILPLSYLILYNGTILQT